MYSFKRHCQQESNTLTSCQVKSKLLGIHLALFLVLQCDKKKRPAQEFPFGGQQSEGSRTARITKWRINAWDFQKVWRVEVELAGQEKNLPTPVCLEVDNPYKWPRVKGRLPVKQFRYHVGELPFYTQTKTMRASGNQSGTMCGRKKKPNNYSKL